MDEGAFAAAVAARDGFAKQEAADLVTAGLWAILGTLGQTAGSAHLRHALSQLPAEYRRLATAVA
jgi:hypothetical protein